MHLHNPGARPKPQQRHSRRGPASSDGGSGAGVPRGSGGLPTLWRKNGWTARVIKNQDAGWAVEIRKAGLSEPALISPWVMGRDKKNPKPFDGPAFATFVKTASEVLDRSARQRDQAMKKRLSIAWEGRWYEVTLELVPDEYEPYALLCAVDDGGQLVAKHRVASNYKFNRDVANDWVRGGFAAPS